MQEREREREVRVNLKIPCNIEGRVMSKCGLAKTKIKIEQPLGLCPPPLSQVNTIIQKRQLRKNIKFDKSPGALPTTSIYFY